MNKRLVAIFVASAGFAGLISFNLYRLVLADSPSQTEKPVVQNNTAQSNIIETKVVLATRDIQAGSLLSEADLREAFVTGPLATSVLHSSVEALGRGVVSAIYRDEPIVVSRLAAKGTGAGFASMIPVGMRAVAVPVKEDTISPGMRVDVLVSGIGSSEGGPSSAVCRTILQNIEVLSGGRMSERTVNEKLQPAQVVNLLVTPAQAEMLDLASGEMNVHLIVRNPLDTEDSATKGIYLTKLLGKNESGDTTAQPARKPRVPLVRSSNFSRQPGFTMVEVYTQKHADERQNSEGK